MAFFPIPFSGPGACRRSTTEGTVISFRTSRPPRMGSHGGRKPGHGTNEAPGLCPGLVDHDTDITLHGKAEQTRAQQKCYVAEW